MKDEAKTKKRLISELRELRQTVNKLRLLVPDDVNTSQKLEESRNMYFTIFQTTGTATAVVEEDGTLSLINAEFERLCGFPKEEVEGKKTNLAFVAETDRQRIINYHQMRRANRQSVPRNYEFKFVDRYGNAKDVLATIDMIPGTSKDVSSLLDITEHKRLESQLIQAAKMNSLAVMAGGIAHQLRNPLSIISATAQLLGEQSEHKQLRDQCVKKIKSTVRRASLIIENMLNFARPQQDNMADVNVHTALKETLDLITYHMTSKNIRLQKDFATDLPGVYGNKELLQQIFANLVLNACNAMPDGGELKVTTRAIQPDQVEIRFEDSGRGISPSDMPFIFDPFFTTMPAGEGTGLGLSISYGIVQKLQGTIDVKSRLEQGTTVIVRLPAISR
jgi:PAS domain S-box-containing protein